MPAIFNEQNKDQVWQKEPSMTKRVKTIAVLSILFITLFSASCSKPQPAEDPSDEELVNIAKTYVNNSTFAAKDKIDYSICTIRTIKETNDGGITDAIVLDNQNDNINDDDILITVGETSEHNFAVLLIDRKILEVKGYLPLK